MALGGGAYAAVHVNGKDIENRTIAGKKIKNDTLGGKQINEGRLGEVPRAAQAQSAGSASNPTTATTATTAATSTTATNAENATNAANAAKLDGSPPSDFLVSCPAATTLYGGVCWENTSRTASGWILASETCGNAGGRLPSLSELVAYTDQPGTQVTEAHWSADVVSTPPGAPLPQLGMKRASSPAALTRSLIAASSTAATNRRPQQAARGHPHARAR